MFDRELFFLPANTACEGGDGLNLSAQLLLEADHRSLDDLLSTLRQALSRGEAGLIYTSLDRFWARLAVHIRAEHLVVFPAVLESLEKDRVKHASISRVVQDLRRDHDLFMKELATAIKAMRSVPRLGNETETIDSVRRRVDGIAGRLEIHDRIEEETIYPLADGSMENAATRSIAERTKRELENLPERFRTAE